LTVAGGVIAARSAFQATPTHGSALAAEPVKLAGVAHGACVVYPAAGRGNGRTVFLDPGNGGVDPGVVAFTPAGRPVFAKDLTLAVASKLATLLEADGYRVAMSRTGDTSVAQLGAEDLVAGGLTADAQRADLLKRAACANASDASLAVSIHFNAVADPGIGGTQTFYASTARLAEPSRELANDVQSALVAATGATSRGVWSDAQLPSAGVQLGASAMPGVVVEPLFLTDSDDLAFATDPAGQDRIALGLKIGIESYLGGR
jgi:N-acetylmuramoyl-L-alanine amidase